MPISLLLPHSTRCDAGKILFLITSGASRGLCFRKINNEHQNYGLLEAVELIEFV